MVINDKEIKRLIKEGSLNINPHQTDVTENCVDLHLDNILIKQQDSQLIDIENKKDIKHVEFEIGKGGYIL